MKRPIAALCLSISAFGCAEGPKSEVKAALSVMASERSPDKLLERGRAFAEVGDHVRAEQYLAAALEQGAPPNKVLPLLLRVCVADRRYRVAIDYVEPQLKKSPNDYHLRFVLASLYAGTGDVKAARAELLRVTTDAPSFAPARFAFGVLLRDEDGDLVGADAQFREYLKLDPSGSHAEEARGSLLRKVVDVPRAPILAVPPGDKPDGVKDAPPKAPKAPSGKPLPVKIP